MRVIVTGGSGFIGRRLAFRLLELNALTASDGSEAPVEKLVLFDRTPPDPKLAADPRVEFVSGDIADPDEVEALIAPGAGAIFHLAAVVSAGAEEDFDLGMSVNLQGTMNVLASARRAAREAPPARLVFASSVAVYGGDMPGTVPDRLMLNPQTSYGTQKAIGELLVQDHARKGHVDGRSLRFPTVVVRPGKPNRAASTWASSIIREPLTGAEAVCPVDADQAMYVLSPRKVVDAIIRAEGLPTEAWGPARMLALPGRTFTVREMLAALAAVAGERVASRVRFEPDPFVQAIVDGWATHFDPARGLGMGFGTDGSFESIIEAFIEDELGGTFVA